MKTLRSTTDDDRSTAASGPSASPGKRTLVEALGVGAPQDAAAAAAEVIVTASSLRVRSSPETSSKQNIVGKLHDGDRVPVSGKDGAWLITPYAGQPAYISGKHTKPATIVDDAQDWFSSLFGGGGGSHEHEDDGPATPKAPSIDPAEPAAPAGPETPTPVPAPSGTGQLANPVLAGFVASLGNPLVTAAAAAVASCEQQSATLATNLDAHEERGAGRDALVASIGQARTQIAALDGANLGAEALAYIKPELHRIVTACAPYYSQGRNIDVLETAGETRTCNLTALAMVLEGLGKSANDYAGARERVIAVAKFTPYAPRVAKATGRTSGATGDWGTLAALRLPDFLQLAAVAECLGGGTSEADILAAAQSAWTRIVKTFTIHIELARQLGVAGKERVLEGGLGGALGGIKKSARKDMQLVVDARNEAEQSGGADDEAKYEALRDARTDALGGSKIEGKAPLDEYRETVLEHIGGELSRGAGVFMLMAGHYARVQSVSQDHVVVDDPGRDWRSGQKVLWEEARAMGYFKKRIVFG